MKNKGFIKHVSYKLYYVKWNLADFPYSLYNGILVPESPLK